MDVVALISGGKDSFYSLIHCIHNGHRIVALANLHPPTPTLPLSQQLGVTCILPQDAPMEIRPSGACGDGGEDTDEMDSFMYQTIGHNVLPLYPAITGLPLYRAAIVGGTGEGGLAYTCSSSGDDETEDLYRLLEEVVRRHPGVRAVSSGAILSTYQRTRVESVCARLGVTSLAYLWRRGQGGLVRELGGGVGLDARIVKVAAVGMDGGGWLWRGVGEEETRRRLQALRRRWGVHVAGEGGEYETLVVGCAGWRGGITVGGEGGVEEGIVRREERGGVAWVRVVKARVVWKEGRGGGDGGEAERQKEWARGVRRLRELNWLFEGVWRRIRDSMGDTATATATTTKFNTTPSTTQTLPKTTTHTSGPIHTINNLHILSHPLPPSSSSTTSAPPTIQTEIHHLLTTLHTPLLLPPTHTLTAIHLLLRDITHFPLINPVYSTFFPHPNPPTRITVSTGPRSLPAGVNILIHATSAATSPHPRNALHIQSTSYWAPANIGPYSQAIEAARSVVEISGMIGLVPRSMEVYVGEGGVGYEAVLAYQHVWRVAREMKVGWWMGGAAAYVTGEEGRRAAQRVWMEGGGRGGGLWMESGVEGEDGEGEERVDRVGYVDEEEDAGVVVVEDGDEDMREDVWGQDEEEEEDGLDSIPPPPPPPLIILQVSALPRNARVEWALAGIKYYPEAEEDHQPRHTIIGQATHVQTWRGGAVATFAMPNATWVSVEEIAERVSELGEGLRVVGVTVYCLGGGRGGLVEHGGEREWRDAVRIVPVDRVWWDSTEVGVCVVVRLLRTGEDGQQQQEEGE